MMKLLLRYYILRCLWTLLLTIHVCRADLRSSYSKLHYGRKLERRMITSYDKYSILDCVEDCLRTTRCRSINYYQGAHFCQTNFKSSTDVPEHYIEKPGWIYTDIGDWDKEIAGACSRSSCDINEKCVPKPFDDFDCVLSDCGIPEGPEYSLDKVEEWDGIGITRGIHLACSPRYTQHGSGFFLCRSDGSWRKNLRCILKRNERTCEGKTMNLTCASGNIFIEKAMFGRTEDGRVCNHTQIQTTNCTSPYSEVKVKEICDGKPQCSIVVVSATFGGDPCQNTFKYLEVNFICY
eukprot:XP_019922806.1 PREDICTED: uncharacterized protein LOC105328288 [Crassostrea gigas]